MHPRVIVRSAIFFACLMPLPALAQQSQKRANNDLLSEQAVTARQSAISLMEEALASTGSLTVPANRLAIELRAFPIVWSRGETRARALIQQMAGDFGEAANASTQIPDQNPADSFNGVRNQRNSITRAIAKTDPELALVFLSATLPCLKAINPEGDPEDHALVIDLASQVALRDPRRALQLAEQQLKEADDLPQSLIGLLNRVQRYDSEAGARLFRDIVDHLRAQNLADDPEALSFAASLLANQFSFQSETGKPDNAVRTLAEMIANTALNSDVMQDHPYVMGNAVQAALDALVPSKSAILFPKKIRAVPSSDQPPIYWQKFNQATARGDSNGVLALLSQAPDDVRPEMMEQAAWNFASSGDMERARVAAQSLEPWKTNSILQLAVRTASFSAATRGDFGKARALAAQITDEDLRATFLSDVALQALKSRKTRIAEDLLAEATSLVMNHAAGTSTFAAQLKVAQAYLHVKPAQAIQLLERSASQLEQALSAAAQLDGFLPDRHSFEGNELILNQGFLFNSLLEPYAQATSELAIFDLAAARALADRLSLPEARLITEVVIATGVLEKKDQTQTASNPRSDLIVEGEDQ